MKRSSSSDQQISTSFKRVKISTSPGELRLNRDFDLLLQNNHWIPSKENNPPGGRLVELSCHNATLVRDAVDPLRMSLCMVQSAGTTVERWTFCLQMPRMYPHVPPSVTRVSREILPVSGGYDTACAVMVASSVMQRGEVPVPERVVVKSLPPSRADGLQCYEEMECANLSTEEGEFREIDAATAVYNQWSPVSSLGDLIEFLMGIPERRRQWWSIESNRRAHFQSVKSFTVTPVGHPTMHPTAQPMTMQYSNHTAMISSPQRCYRAHNPSSPCDMEEETLECPIEGSPFIANRFDVGYERGSIVHPWGIL